MLWVSKYGPLDEYAKEVDEESLQSGRIWTSVRYNQLSKFGFMCSSRVGDFLAV